MKEKFTHLESKSLYKSNTGFNNLWDIITKTFFFFSEKNKFQTHYDGKDKITKDSIKIGVKLYNEQFHFIIHYNNTEYGELHRYKHMFIYKHTYMCKILFYKIRTIIEKS